MSLPMAGVSQWKIVRRYSSYGLDEVQGSAGIKGPPGLRHNVAGRR